jgi:ubiquinone/menaquinone biosynthesis C-methylase UbiE
MRRRGLVAITLALGLVIWRHPLAGIRLVRWLDQRSGIDGPAGARIYDALLAPLGGWLYRRVASDAVLAVGDQVAPTIVDIGTGPGLLLIAVAARYPTATIIGIDPAEPMRAAAARRLALADLADRVALLAGVAERLPLPDGSVDLVVSTLASHHWSDPAMAIDELLRVLRPGARALVYDLRFVALSEKEIDRLTIIAGVDRDAIFRRTLKGGLLRLFALVTITAPDVPVVR